MENPLISIIVPVYNVELFLERCVISLKNQSYENIEIILVDDGSPDNCPSICDRYAESDSRIHVVHKENGGLSDARNVGIILARGEYIAFVDSDDVVSSCYIEYLYRAIKETGSIMAMCNLTKFSKMVPAFSNVYKFPVVYGCEELFLKMYSNEIGVCSIVAWSKLYHKSLFTDIRFPKNKIHEDEFTVHYLLDAAKNIAFVDCPLYGYYQNQNGIMNQQYSSKKIDALEAFMDRHIFFKEYGYNNLVRVSADRVVAFLIYLISIYSQVKDLEQYKKRLSNIYPKLKKQVLSDVSPKYKLILELGINYRVFRFVYIILKPFIFFKNFIKNHIVCK